MPQVFHPNRPSSSVQPPSQPVRLPNSAHVDDNDDELDFDREVGREIIVRSGEASRLRRRGAVHLRERERIPLERRFSRDHGQSTDTLHMHPHGLNLDMNFDAQEFSRDPKDSPTELDGSRGRRSEDLYRHGYVYALVCGARSKRTSSSAPSSYPTASYTPSPLPWLEDPPEPELGHSALFSSAAVDEETNGCGTIVHRYARPSSPGAPSRYHRPQSLYRTIWTAKSQGCERTVVHMDACYFEPSSDIKLDALDLAIRSLECGCVREGVGCAACGNPLGTRFRTCQMHQRGHGHGAAFPSRPRRHRTSDSATFPRSYPTPTTTAPTADDPAHVDETLIDDTPPRYTYTFLPSQVSASLAPRPRSRITSSYPPLTVMSNLPRPRRILSLDSDSSASDSDSDSDVTMTMTFTTVNPSEGASSPDIDGPFAVEGSTSDPIFTDYLTASPLAEPPMTLEPEADDPALP